MLSRKIIAAVSGVGAVAVLVLALAVADRGSQPSGGAVLGATEKGGPTATAGKPAAKGKAKGKGKNYVASGTVASVDAAGGVVSIAVTSGPGGVNRAAQAWRGQTIQFDVSGAQLQIGDTNGDGTSDLNDVAVGDRAQVQARLASTDAQPYSARRVKDVTSLEAEDDTTTTPTTTTPTTTTP